MYREIHLAVIPWFREERLRVLFFHLAAEMAAIIQNEEWERHGSEGEEEETVLSSRQYSP